MSRVRIGMIGCGGMARAHLRQLLELPEAEIVAFADPDPEQISLCRRMFPTLAQVPAFADYRQMLAEVSLDAVELNTPHSQHAEQTLACFGRGLHVLCEKPLVTTSSDAEAVLRARDASGRIGLLSYQRHYAPEFRKLREFLQSGEFGALTFMQAVLGQEWKRLTAGTWRQDPTLSGGGQLNDSGSHIVDILLWASGLEPERVTALCDNRGAPVDIDSVVTVRFRGGAFGSIAVLGDFPIWHEDWTICCERGAFLIREGRLTVLNERGERSQPEVGPALGNPDSNFVGAIIRGEPVEATFEDGQRVIRLTEAAWDSAARGGEPVRL